MPWVERFVFVANPSMADRLNQMEAKRPLPKAPPKWVTKVVASFSLQKHACPGNESKSLQRRAVCR